ncbi:MAG TPA: fumarylacetoacetate hydrolase family protein [Egibacteraceae bacterium]|nr:fumarylacetoacetate hydrolase family protein [Egibacteraceae bacterium]
MRIVRVARPAGPAFGVVRDGHVVLIEPHPFTSFTLTDQVAPLDRVRLLAPVIPSKVLCVGLNYADHAAELGVDLPAEPLIFDKLATAVVGPGADIRLPALSREVHHEAEVAVVIGRVARRVGPGEALGAVAGYTCANDVTARDLQRRDGQWTRAKGFDTFCPLGPWIDTDADPADGLAVRCRVNGELRQDGTTADFVFGVAELVSYASSFTTLLPGDVLLTGTPAGVGELRDGDTVEVGVAGIGTLSNPAVSDAGHGGRAG